MTSECSDVKSVQSKLDGCSAGQDNCFAKSGFDVYLLWILYPDFNQQPCHLPLLIKASQTVVLIKASQTVVLNGVLSKFTPNLVKRKRLTILWLLMVILVD
jgi:hypothetical protein